MKSVVLLAVLFGGPGEYLSGKAWGLAYGGGFCPLEPIPQATWLGGDVDYGPKSAAWNRGFVHGQRLKQCDAMRGVE